MLREKYRSFKFHHVGYDCTWTNWFLEKMKGYPIFSQLRRHREMRRADKNLQEAIKRNESGEPSGIIYAESAMRTYKEFNQIDKLPKATSAWRIAHMVASQFFWEASFRAACQNSSAAEAYRIDVDIIDERMTHL